MIKRYLVRTLAAAAVSLVTKVVMKKVQGKKVENKEQQRTSGIPPYPPHSN